MSPIRGVLESANDDVCRTACAELYRRLRSTTPEASSACTAADGGTQLDTGLALGSSAAATCLLDGRRTRAMLRGALSAIRDATARSPDRVVEVVYAGTGPLAPFAVLLIPLLDAERVRFTLIDIEPASTSSVRSLVHHFGLEPFVRAVVCTDATRYRHPTPIDVVISETMQRSLAREPLVSILRNLRPQLAAGGVVVPERVTIDLALIGAVGEQARWNGDGATGTTTRLATIFEVTRDGETPGPNESARVTIPRLPRSDTEWTGLLTRIETFAGNAIEPYESGLTMPEILWPLSPPPHGTTIDFRYDTGPDPGVRWVVLP